MKPSPTLTGLDIVCVEYAVPRFYGQYWPELSCCRYWSTDFNLYRRNGGSPGLGALRTPHSVQGARYVDVVQNAYNFVLDTNGTALAKSNTVLSDQNGRRLQRSKRTQALALRLHDSGDRCSGNRVTSKHGLLYSRSMVLRSWCCTAAVGGTRCIFANSVLVPAAVDYLVYGGTPPYTVRNDAPNFVGLLAEGVSSPTQVVVSRAGGRFTAIAGYSSACAAD